MHMTTRIKRILHMQVFLFHQGKIFKVKSHILFISVLHWVGGQKMKAINNISKI